MSFNVIGDFLTFEEYCNLKPKDEVYFDWTKRILATYPKLEKIDDKILVKHKWALKTSNGFIHIDTSIFEDEYPLYDVWRSYIFLEYDGDDTVWSDI